MEETIADETLRRMVRCVESDWTVREASPAERGFCSVYHLVVETPDSTRECVLKATPDGGDNGIPADARLLALLGAHTSIPVPAVLGLVDDHPELRAPFYLMEAMPGRDVSYESVGWVSDPVLRTVARQVGAFLGELHRIDGVESFGALTHDESRQYVGDRPPGSLDDLTFIDAYDTWTAFLREWTENALTRLESSRFAALTPRLDAWCKERIDRLPGPFSPALGRNDHGFHNLLLDPDTGDVTAMLDWGFTLAVPPAFDFHYAAYLFSGAFVSGLPDVPDRRELVRDAMLAGYRSTAPELADAVSVHRPLYELLAMVRVMHDFESLTPKLPDGTEEAVAEGLQGDVESVLDATE